MVADIASKIESRLKAQVKLSNIKYGIFIDESE
jgi:hypothetical protein